MHSVLTFIFISVFLVKERSRLKNPPISVSLLHGSTQQKRSIFHDLSRAKSQSSTNNEKGFEANYPNSRNWHSVKWTEDSSQILNSAADHFCQPDGSMYFSCCQKPVTEVCLVVIRCLGTMSWMHSTHNCGIAWCLTSLLWQTAQ